MWAWSLSNDYVVEGAYLPRVDHPLESEKGLTLEEKVSNELEACNAIKEKCSIKCFKNWININWKATQTYPLILSIIMHLVMIV